MLEAGLAEGTLEAGFGGALGADGGALPKVGDDLPLDRLPPRGIIITFEVENLRGKKTKSLCKTGETVWRSDLMQNNC